MKYTNKQFFTISASHFIRQDFNQEPDYFGYFVYFQLHTKPTSLNNVAGYVMFEIFESTCRKILPDVDDASTSFFLFLLYLHCLPKFKNVGEISVLFILHRASNSKTFELLSNRYHQNVEKIYNKMSIIQTLYLGLLNLYKFYRVRSHIWNV